nr:VOC family protein [Polymorphobacter sp.]
MATQNQGPTGGLTPHIMILNNRAAEAITFYKAAFGAEERVRMLADDGVRLMHAHLEINGSSLMLADDFPEYKGPGATPEGSPAGIVLHLQVDDADAWFERAVAAGATVRMPLQDMFWGDRYGHLGDPFGFVWSIATPIKA